MRIDLNADVGEGVGDDAELIPLVTSVNIACGAHAGDPDIMARTVALAVAAGVGIGAHPGYPDRAGFGRREMEMSYAGLEASLLSQLGALAEVVRGAGAVMRHVKPHGALYNHAAKDAALAAVVARAVAQFDARLVLVGLTGSELLSTGREAGLAVASEAFADRLYEPDGSLRSRRFDDAILASPDAAAEQAVAIATRGLVTSRGGSPVEVRADTLCLHGDTPDAVAYAQAIRAALTAADVMVSQFGR